MFSIYGVEGRVFYGPLETMPRVRPADSAQAVMPLHPDEPSALPLVGSFAGHSAAKAYQETHDLDRGPLYQAAQIMRRPVVAVGEQDAVESAWRLLRDRRIHQAPVLDANRHLVGIVSERDLLTAINIDERGRLDVLDRQVGDVMTSPVVAALPETDIRRIAQVMLQHGVDGVPVVNEAEALIGFISRSDILRAVVTDPPLSLWR